MGGQKLLKIVGHHLCTFPLINYLPWPAEAGGEVGGREVMLGVTGSKMGGAVAGAAGGDTGGTSWPGVVGSIIEFTTCFH